MMAAPSKTLVALALLLAVAVLAAAAQLTDADCIKKNVTVQNLSTHNVTLTEQPSADSPHLFDGPRYPLPRHSQAQFTVCWFNGYLRADGVAATRIDLTERGWCSYTQENYGRRVSVIVAPLGKALRGYCPAIDVGQQRRFSTGTCGNVQEIEVIYLEPKV